MKKSVKIIRTCTVPRAFSEALNGQLKFLNNYFNVIAVSSSGILLEETKKREGVRTISVEIERRISPLKDLISLIKLYVVFKREKPVIVHSINPKAGLLTMLAAKLAGVPIRIHTFTGLIFPTKTGFMQKLLITMDRLLCWSSTNIYPEGQGVKNDLISYKITSKPLKILANGNVNGIDVSFFNPQKITEDGRNRLRETLKVSKTDFIFIFVGRLVGDKGVNELVSAFELVKKYTKKKIKLLFVGGRDIDPLKSETLTKIDNNNDIIEVGYQTDVRPYFAIAHCLVFPSYREGFPNVVIQAGAMGIPSIVSDINGCNEIIEHNKNGLIIPSKNVEELKNSMLELLNDDTLYNKLRQNNREMIINRYEQSVVWKALLKEYRELLK